MLTTINLKILKLRSGRTQMRKSTQIMIQIWSSWRMIEIARWGSMRRLIYIISHREFYNQPSRVMEGSKWSQWCCKCCKPQGSLGVQRVRIHMHTWRVSWKSVVHFRWREYRKIASDWRYSHFLSEMRQDNGRIHLNLVRLQLGAKWLKSSCRNTFLRR